MCRGAPAVVRREQVKVERRAVRLARYEEVVTLQRAGVPVTDIIRRTGLSRGTIDRWLAADAFPERAAHPPRRSALDSHAAYLRARWAAGCHNATALWRELRARGVPPCRTQVCWYVRTRLRGRPATTPRAPGEPYTAPATKLSARRLAWLLTQPTERLADADQAVVTQLCAASPT